MPVIFSPSGGLDAAALEEEIEARYALYRRFGLLEDGCVRVGEQWRRCPRAAVLVDYVIRRRHDLGMKARQGFTDLEIGLATPGQSVLAAIQKSLREAKGQLASANYRRLRVGSRQIDDYWYHGDPAADFMYLVVGQWYPHFQYYDNLPFPGLNVVFVRPADDRMSPNSSDGSIQGRPTLYGGTSPDEMYAKFGREPYRFETAFTTDVALARVLRLVTNHNIMPYTFKKGESTAAWCPRTFFQIRHELMVPNLYWSEAEGMLCCDRGSPLSKTKDCAHPAMVDLQFLRG